MTAASVTPIDVAVPTVQPTQKKLGRLAPKSDPRALMFARFARAPRKLPVSTDFWPHKHHFENRTFGNTQFGDCTRASQAIGSLRMEFLETKKVPHIDDEEVTRAFVAMCDRLYNGDTNGAYIMDALNCWRNPDYTFRDAAGHPLTIDAYTKIHPSDQQELRQAIWTAGAHGIVIGINLPKAFETIEPPKVWDIPAGQPAVGDWLPGSLGGHCMWARDYDEKGVWLVHTWGCDDQLITWPAAALYIDEAYMVIDSIDKWRAKKRPVKFTALQKAVNEVSSYKLEK